MLAEPNEEHVAGDDPSLSSKVGIFDLARNGHRVRVRYKDQHVYCEVYRAADGSQEVHWMCPRCHGGARGYMSRIPSSRKQIDFDPARLTEVGGELNVEAFVCPGELGEDRRQDFGIGLCKLELVIDNSVARNA